MNIQAMMKQAKQLQNDMMKTKKEIDDTIYTGKSSFVTATVKGTKEVVSITIDNNDLTSEDIEMLQDMIVVAINDANKQVDADIDSKLGKYTQGMPGLF
jgi:hypothetical protein